MSTDASDRRGWSRRAELAALWAIGLLFIVHLGLRVQLLASYRYDISGAEFNVIHGIQKVMLDRPLYNDPEKPPFDIVQYTPLYYFACGEIAHLLGIDAFDVRGVYLCSRILSLLLNLITMGLVAALLRKLGVSRSWAWIAAALVYFSFSEHFYSRVDSLYALFSVVCLRSIMEAVESSTARPWLMSGLWAVLCFMTKQTAVLLMVVVPLYLLLIRNWRALFTFAGSVAGTFLVCIALLLAYVPGDHLLKNMVGGLMNGVSPNFLLDLFNSPKYFLLAGWHIVALFLPLFLLRSEDRRTRFIGLSVPFSLFFALLTAFKTGSQFNYFFESLVFTFLAMALYFGREEEKKEGTSELTRLVAERVRLLILVHAVFFCGLRIAVLHYWSDRFGTPRETVYAYVADRAVRDVLVNEMGLQDGDGVFVTYRGYMELFLNGNSLVSQKDVLEWSQEIPFDLSAFHKAMQEGTVRYVIRPTPGDTINFLDSTYTNYRQVREVHGRCILAPITR